MARRFDGGLYGQGGVVTRKLGPRNEMGRADGSHYPQPGMVRIFQPPVRRASRFASCSLVQNGSKDGRDNQRQTRVASATGTSNVYKATSVPNSIENAPRCALCLC